MHAFMQLLLAAKMQNSVTLNGMSSSLQISLILVVIKARLEVDWDEGRLNILTNLITIINNNTKESFFHELIKIFLIQLRSVQEM